MKADLKIRLYVAAALLFPLFVEAGLQTRLYAQNLTPERQGRLFPPENLGLLEAPDREAWQKPEQIMDALGVAEGSTVADIGAGAGWFTIQLARRVGPNGAVYAQDVQRQMLEAIRRRVAREGLQNVQTRLGAGSTPNLPERTFDAILVVDVYDAVDEPVPLLRNLAAALKPGGRLGIVNYKPGNGGPGPGPDEGIRVDSASVERDASAAGLRVLARQTLPYQYLLVLGR
jgi:protein-L-isoaspartate O-methyltransferase